MAPSLRAPVKVDQEKYDPKGGRLDFMFLGLSLFSV